MTALWRLGKLWNVSSKMQWQAKFKQHFYHLEREKRYQRLYHQFTNIQDTLVTFQRLVHPNLAVGHDGSLV
jgi:hypothetical protein